MNGVMTSDAIPRGRNYDFLARENPIPNLDELIVFDEEAHRYTVRGEPVPRSATKIVSDAVAEQPFDGDAIILKNLASWRSNPTSKYGQMVQGLDDESAALKIKHTWAQTSVLGTKLHKRLEASLNDDVEPADGETDVEWKQLTAALSELQEAGWVPRRTELSLFWERASDNAVVCAGQLDALFSNANDELVLVDLKRTEKDLSPDVVPFRNKRCKPPLDKLYANECTKYSLQQSIYAVMFEQRTGLQIPPDNRWLLQAHPSLPHAKWTRCLCLDAEARQLLDDAM